MGRPSKFTAPIRQRILEAKKIGASDRTAARVAGVDPQTLANWLKRGREGPKDSNYRQFVEEFDEAEAHPKERALAIIYNALPDRPDLAWKYIERRETGYAPPVQGPPIVAPTQVNVLLSFDEMNRPLPEVTVDAREADPDQAERRELPPPAPRSATGGGEGPD